MRCSSLYFVLLSLISSRIIGESPNICHVSDYVQRPAVTDSWAGMFPTMYKSVGMFRCCSQTLISSSFPLKKSLKMLYLHVCAILWIMMFFCDIHRVVCTWRPSHCQCSQIILIPICLSMQGLLIVNCMWHHFWRTTPSVGSLDRTVFWLIFSLYQSGFSCCIKHTLQVKTEETVADLRHRPLEALVIFHIGPELKL